MLDLLPTVVDVARRAVRRRVDPADLPALAVHARVGHGRARRRRRRRAARRLPDLPGRPPRAAATACRDALHERVVRPARRPAAGLDRELQPRLQAQALPARRSARPRRPPRDLARLVHARRAGARCSTRDAGRPVRGAASRLRERADGDPARAADLPLREDLPPGRHPREGRPGEHGAARSRCGRRSSTSSSSSSSAAFRRDSSCAASTRSTCSSARWRDVAARRDREPPEEGLRHPGRRTGSRASCASRCRTSSRPSGLRAAGDLRPGRGRAARLRAPDRPARPPQAALDALRLPALASALDREASATRTGEPRDRDRIAILARR